MREPPWDVRGDLTWGTTPGLLRDCARTYGDEPAVVDGDVRLGFADLERVVGETARALMASNVRAADRVAIWLPNSWEWVVAALAAHTVGAVLVPVNTRFKGSEAAAILSRSRARLLVTSGDFLGTDYPVMLRDATVGEALPDLTTVVVARGTSADSGTIGWSDFQARGHDVDDEAVSARTLALSGADLSDILFTSGTTGRPKGIMSTHSQTLRCFRDWAEIVGLRAGDRYLIVNPFFHGFGYKAGWLASLMMGCTTYPMPVLDPLTVYETVEAERITVLPGTPTLYQTMLTDPRRHKFDLSSLRLSVTGGSVVPVELIHRMRAELGFESIITGYGLTESCAISTMSRRSDPADTIAHKCGRPIPGTEVVVVDADGRRITGEPGDVIVRGYNVMKGYLDDPQATNEVIDSDGFLHTGDIGVIDELGYLSITDRKKDMFIVGGFNTFPAEIESIVLGNDAVARVSIVAVPDERLGEVAVAFVMLRPDRALSAGDLIGWCREHMANYKVPRHVLFVDTLPMNASGKVLKDALRADARQALGVP
jgi:HIP---CoA ligase